MSYKCCKRSRTFSGVDYTVNKAPADQILPVSFFPYRLLLPSSLHCAILNNPLSLIFTASSVWKPRYAFPFFFFPLFIPIFVFNWNADFKDFWARALLLSNPGPGLLAFWEWQVKWYVLGHIPASVGEAARICMCVFVNRLWQLWVLDSGEALPKTTLPFFL